MILRNIYKRLQLQYMDLIPTPCLAIVLANDRSDSLLYVKRKLSALDKMNFRHVFFKLGPSVTEIKDCLTLLNEDSAVHGILLQSPLYERISPNFDALSAHVAKEKDVDGLVNNSFYTPCTALAVTEILSHYAFNVKGKHALVIGRSKVAGGPIAKILAGEDATVTVAHSNTPKDLLESLIASADIIVAAVGKAGIINAAQVKPNAILIDVGISNSADGSICGDVAHAANRNYYYTPVPGGVGPVTVAKLVENLLEAYKRQIKP
jgi:methylenetetrahydrofolate dehydrogenase (NADP+) / methenyltetrahydrofolate cyclohydrolase